MRFRDSATTVLVVTAVVAAVAGALASQSGPPRATAAHRSSVQIAKRADGLLSWRDVDQPDVFMAGTGLYLTWVTSPVPPRRAPVHEELARVGSKSGRVTAETSVRGQVMSACVDSASLLVLVTSKGEELLRLDPITLEQTGHWHIGRAQVPGSEASAMVRAGGSLWIATGPELVRFTVARWKISLRIPLAGAINADLATTTTGSVLLVGEADEGGLGHIERRGVVSGQLMSESPPLYGIVNPFLTAVTGNYFWASEATGMMGHVQQFSVTPLVPVGTCRTGIRTQTCVFGTNGITARMSNGRLFVTQPAGGRVLNFCATTGGKVLAPLPIPLSDDVRAVGKSVLFVLVPSARYRTALKEMTIPQACVTTRP